MLKMDTKNLFYIFIFSGLIFFSGIPVAFSGFFLERHHEGGAADGQLGAPEHRASHRGVSLRNDHAGDGNGLSGSSQQISQPTNVSSSLL